MKTVTVVQQILTWCLLITSIVVVAGGLIGQPLLLSFVESGSMAPALETGDGFVAIPTAVAGDIGSGDVVVFEARAIEGGGLVTHRVVDETDRGYITRGDANPFTDQASGEPAVQRPQIQAVAVQPGGTLVSVPGVGAVVMASQTLVGYLQRPLAQLSQNSGLLARSNITGLISIGSVLAYLVAAARDRGDGRDRSAPRDGDPVDGLSVRTVLIVVTILLVAAATATMMLPSGTTQLGLISAEFDSDSPTIIPAGETDQLNYTVQNSGLLPVYTYFSSSGDAVDPATQSLQVDRRSSENITVALTVPPETGSYSEWISEHRYLAVLPGSVIDSLYRLHPIAPIVAIDALLAALVYSLGSLMFGGSDGRLRLRDVDRPRSWIRRIRSR